MFFHLSRERRFAVSVPYPRSSHGIYLRLLTCSQRARFYAAEIVLAIEALHAEGFIYRCAPLPLHCFGSVSLKFSLLFWFCFTEVVLRDLKPENVLLGSDGNLCLTDFGLSKESVQDNELVHTFVGTTEYLAPEILRQRGYTKAVDWWSLGVLLCVMCFKR